MISVFVVFPNDQRLSVLLADVPRTGDHIRLKNGANTPSYAVKQVIWIEGSPEPSVAIVVEPHLPGGQTP